MRVVLKHDKLREWQRLNEWSDRQFARFLQLSPSTVSRTMSGKCHPGSRFISSVLKNTGCPFASFFGVAE